MHKGLVAALLLVACDTGIHGQDQPRPDAGTPPDAGAPADAHVSAACLEATHHSDFAWIRDNVFAVNCSFSTACHKGSVPKGHLDLTAAKAFNALVNVKSFEQPLFIRVKPGDPENSYLMIKLGTFPGPIPPGGKLMPPNSPPLCKQKQDAIVRWIERGALEVESVDAGVPDAPPPTPDAGRPTTLDAAVPPVDASAAD